MIPMKPAVHVALALLVPTVLLASEPTAAHRKAIKEAESLGRAIYNQDVTSARATDALMAATTEDQRALLRGWIVTDSKENPAVEFVAKKNDTWVARFEVLFDPKKRPELRKLTPERELRGDDLARFSARQIALAARPGSCSESYNTIVLPNRAGKLRGWLVYLLAATTDDNDVLVGGHYRALVSEDGTKLISIEPLSKSCLVMRKLAETGSEVKALFMTHVLGETPIETHVYLNLLHKVDFYVMTEAGIWFVTNGSIAYAGPPPK